MEAIIFYSWQSDTKPAANRSFIEKALESAIKDIQTDDKISINPVIDRDTLSTPGAPDIGATIFEKIEKSQIFVGDVTIINSHVKNGRPTPNPNILIELGYALKVLGWARIILIQNTFYGNVELLPFDIRQRRIMKYFSPDNSTSRSDEKNKLQNSLTEAITFILSSLDKKNDMVSINISHEVLKQTQDIHEYRLIIKLENHSNRRVDDWQIDVQFPTRLLKPGSIHVSRIPNRSNSEYSLFRSNHHTHGGSISSGDAKVAYSLEYYIDDHVYKDEFLDMKLIVKLFLDGELKTTEERLIRELQSF